MDNTGITWAAGFLEGEGCFGYYGYNPLVTGTQKDREPLERLRSAFKVGTVRETHKSTGRTYHTWIVNGQDAIAVMETVLPWMCSRRADKIREVLAINSAHKDRLSQQHNKPTCNQGHLWAEHGGVRRKGRGTGVRYCKECSRLYQVKRRARLRSNP